MGVIPYLTQIIKKMTDKNENQSPGERDVIEHCTQIAVAYINNNAVDARDLKQIIRDIYEALQSPHQTPATPAARPQSQPVSSRNTITPDYLICLEDGRPYRSLKRHLKVQYNMSPEEYRRKWGLPDEYPMVAPNYSKLRSVLAKSALGTRSAA